MRLTYAEFADEVELADLEVRREFAGVEHVQVIARSIDATGWGVLSSRLPPWGEFYPPHGPIVLWQLAYEYMPDAQNYRKQIREVLRHEYRHAIGRDDHEVRLLDRKGATTPPEWVEDSPLVVVRDGIRVTLA